MFRRWFFELLILTATVWLAACVPVTSPSPVAATSDPVIATDALGRTLHFDAPPQRIVVAGKAGTLVADVLYTFPEAPRRIVGLVKQAQTPAIFDFYRLLDPQTDAKRVVGRAASAEQIAALHPDVVVMKSFLAKKLGAQIETVGIPVFYLEMETPEQYPEELKQVGLLLGNPGRGQVLAAYYQAQMARAQKLTAGLTAAQRPRVLVVQHMAKGGATAWQIPPADWLQAALVRLAGGRPLWVEQAPADHWQTVTLEQIAAWQPDQIYIVDYFAEPARDVMAFKSDAAAATLTAVQKEAIYPFPKDYLSWDQPDSRWPLGLLWLAKHIQPQRFADVNIRTEAAKFYSTVYGLKGDRLQQALGRLPH